MQGFLDQCIERYLELAGIQEATLKQALTPCLDEHAFSDEDLESKGTLAPVAASIIMKILYMARCCRFDLLYPVCTLARHVTKWSKACDKQLHRLYPT